MVLNVDGACNGQSTVLVSLPYYCRLWGHHAKNETVTNEIVIAVIASYGDI